MCVVQTKACVREPAPGTSCEHAHSSLALSSDHRRRITATSWWTGPPSQQCTEPGSRVLHAPWMVETLGSLTLIICAKSDSPVALFSFSDFGKPSTNPFEYVALKCSSDGRVSSRLHRSRPAGYAAISPRLSVSARAVLWACFLLRLSSSHLPVMSYSPLYGFWFVQTLSRW